MKLATDTRPGIRCTECGARLDPGERCDCERTQNARPATKRIIEHNKPMMKNAFSNTRRINRTYLDFDCK